MASGLAQQNSCLGIRWGQTTPTAAMLHSLTGNLTRSLSTTLGAFPGYAGDLGAGTSPPGSRGPAVAMSSNNATPSSHVTSLPALSTTLSEHRPPPGGAVELAAAMAAKLNAMLMAKGKLKTAQPPPERPAPTVAVSSQNSDLVVTEVDINDVPLHCRNLLTKGQTQEEIRQFSGATISTKGSYMTAAAKAQAKGVNRPLYLHVQGKTQEEVNKAMMRIKEIISEEVLRAASGQPPSAIPVYTPSLQAPRPPVAPPALQQRPPINQNRSSSVPPNQVHSGNFVHTKLFVGLDQTLPSFNVKEKVEGPGGSYLQHIQNETGARVFLRGKGSGYIEQASRRESFEPLYLYISHPNSVSLEAAKKLCENLLETVRVEHSRMMSVYTAPGVPQAYPPSHGYPPNSNHCSQVSWYNYPTNGYSGGYSPYPGSSGYWSSSNGHHSYSNISTTPQSSQAMVQYPVCPRMPPPYLEQDTGTSNGATIDKATSSPPHNRSAKRSSAEEKNLEYQHGKTDPCSGAGLTVSKTEMATSLATKNNDGKELERILMPPPPPPPPIGAVRKRRRAEDGRCGAQQAATGMHCCSQRKSQTSHFLYSYAVDHKHSICSTKYHSLFLSRLLETC
ncbi:KH homology domain-containing protein 4-like isoform X1 [Lepisosteus oculatus]|uniref:KH homology domain-containing protein 4-like isoform X1 n=1 Tax=Lepisosteus oculatus TaxID=7918 RepID=UPI0037177C66